MPYIMSNPKDNGSIEGTESNLKLVKPRETRVEDQDTTQFGDVGVREFASVERLKKLGAPEEVIENERIKQMNIFKAKNINL